MKIGAPRKYSDEARNLVIELRNLGCSVAEIHYQTGMPRSTVSYLANRRGDRSVIDLQYPRRKVNIKPGQMHERVRITRGPASNYTCEDCDDEARDWAQLHDTSGTDESDYVPLCRSCHLGYDRSKS